MKLIQCLLLICLVSCTLSVNWKDEVVENFDKITHKTHFEEWMKAFGRSYSSNKESAHRLKIWINNWRKVIRHNKGNHNWTLGLNQFADMTLEEFRVYIHGHGQSCLHPRMHREKITVSPPKMNKIPNSIDWTKKGVVTPVKNQGSCGSCWAFSTTGSVESRSAIKTGKLVSLSEQELIDCSRRDGNLGCDGGLMDDAFKYVKSEGGLCSEVEYPYKARGELCHARECGTKYDPITGYTDVHADNEEDLRTAVAAGPVSIAVEADQAGWQLYKSGVMSGSCGTSLDHGVLAVGYGTENGVDYWKVKNSWGKTWGMEGYLLICRNCDKNRNKGECGILMQPSYPLV